jgi:hypothetical protein
MQPASFKEANVVLDTPRGASPDDVGPLSACRTTIGDAPGYVTCWKPTAAELKEIAATGRVWVLVLGNAHPPILVTGTRPFPDRPTDPPEEPEALLN